MTQMPKEWNISEMTLEFRMDRKTISKRLDSVRPCRVNGKSKMYWMADVGPAVWGGIQYVGHDTDSELNKLDLNREKARLAKEQADKYELDNAERRGDLVSLEAIQTEYIDMVMSFRAKILSMPSKLAGAMVGETDFKKIRGEMERELHEALDELSAYNPREKEPKNGDDTETEI